MNAIAIIISLIALVGAGFAFLRASSSHRILSKRIEKQNDRIKSLEEKLRRGESGAGKGKSQPRQEEHEQVREPKQKQRDRRQERQQEEQAQERRPQERLPQERKQREKQSQERQPQPQAQERPQQDRAAQDQQTSQQEEGRQQRPRRDKRRRNEPREGSHDVREGNPESREYREPRNQPEPEDVLIVSSTPITFDSAGANLLDELEQAAATTDANPMAEPIPAAMPVEEPAQSGKAYAIIPEDGVIRQHQLQQQPDSDSYIEIDAPGEGENRTHYRFNLAGNHAFVISQGIDRLENAFIFEKPSNRMVSRVVQQLDGVLAKVGNGWKIEEKARIDFR